MPNCETPKSTEKKSEVLGAHIKQFYWDKELEKWVATPPGQNWKKRLRRYLMLPLSNFEPGVGAGASVTNFTRKET